ncbi:tRNA (adenosine(37)-N6)-dimethylallyltransferase [Pseudomonadota bacterium]
MNKLLIICGPTATGKTSLGIQLAQKFTGEIISADSRQVYSGMNIGTGKNLPKNSTLTLQPSKLNNFNVGIYQIHSVPIWGYDLVSPNQDFSVAHFYKFALPTIKDISYRNKLPIVVGGTGLYINSVTSHIKTISIPMNKPLRTKLEKQNVPQLQSILTELNLEKFDNMNHSDRQNPRRLIRAIETSLVQKEHKNPTTNIKHDQLWIGLKAPLGFLDPQVKQNILARATPAFSQEILQLEENNFDWNSLAASSTGYKIWKQYLEKKISKSEAINLWTTTETQYLRRQLTWFNKQKQIHWYDISQPDWYKQVEHRVQDWYS